MNYCSLREKMQSAKTIAYLEGLRISRSGFSIVEIMLALVILAILMSVGAFMISGPFKRQDLATTVDGLTQLIQRGRSQASTRSELIGVKFEATRAFSFIDSNANGAYNSSTDSLLTTYNFRGPVEVASGCGNNAIEVGTREYMYFNAQGFVGEAPSGTFAIKDWQVFLYHPRMDTSFRAREIEALSNGLVEKIKPTEAGNVSTNARQANKAGAICAAP